MSTITIKFQCRNDIRRVSVTQDKLSFDELNNLAKSLFGDSLPSEYVFKYLDDEKDLISVSSDRELEEAFRVLKENILRISIVPKKNKKEKEQKKQDNSTNTNKDSKTESGSFIDVLEKLLLENPFIKDIVNNIEIEVRSIPNNLKELFEVNVSSTNNTDDSKPIHRGVVCDGCEQGIRGIRYKCKQCPDYDLCENCNSKKENIHDKTHTFDTIERPRCPYAAQHKPGQQNPHHNHNHHRGRWGFGGIPNANTNTTNSEEVIHRAVCDSCKQNIRGIRYKCTQCNDYDLCQACEAKKEIVHPGHAFQTITRGRCGFKGFTNQSDVVHFANCDSCHTRIKGIRHKCEQCPDYDLCEKCEPNKNLVHNVDHTFIKILKPQFGCRRAWFNQNSTTTTPSCNSFDKNSMEQTKEEKKVEETSTTPIQVNIQTEVPTTIIEEKLVKVIETPIVQTTTPVVEVVTPVVEVVTPVVAVEKKEEKVEVSPNVTISPFESKLNQLEEMGFVNRNNNVELLVKFNGDMLQTVRALLE